MVALIVGVGFLLLAAVGKKFARWQRGAWLVIGLVVGGFGVHAVFPGVSQTPWTLRIQAPARAPWTAFVTVVTPQGPAHSQTRTGHGSALIRLGPAQSVSASVMDTTGPGPLTAILREGPAVVSTDTSALPHPVVGVAGHQR